MNWRKLLYLPNPEQTLVVLDEMKIIQERMQKIGAIERKEQTENQRTHDGSCPKCRTREGIVDKIALVEGISNFRGNVFKFNGRLAIETKPVNYCNTCHHEWVKFKTKIITDFALTKVILDYLSDIVRNPERNKRYSWKLEAIEVFKDCHAESVYAVQKDYKGTLRHTLTLRQLRTKYKSVFDGKNETNNNSSR